MSKPTRDEIVAAYILDRAEQYDASSGYVTAFADLAKAIQTGEARASYEHGELDDILRRLRSKRAAKGGK